MKELVVISGKGGTGKTSITGALASLYKNSVLADCDVDAPDLHLILSPEIHEKHSFMAGHEAVIEPQKCTGCGNCLEYCRFDAVDYSIEKGFFIKAFSCEGCGVCVQFCPEKAIQFSETNCGAWFVSTTRFGTMVHAQLVPGAENSGRLVSLVRERSRVIGADTGTPLIIADGPPGTGCPVIASVSGVDHALIVTEPSLSALHDLKRTVALLHHFSVSASLCVNKWDIHPEQSDMIIDFAAKEGIPEAGRIPFSEEITEAQSLGLCITELEGTTLTPYIHSLWEKLCAHMNLNIRV